MYASHSATGDPTESQTINISPPAFHAIVTLLPHSFAEVCLSSPKSAVGHDPVTSTEGVCMKARGW